jgi:hypothetical protein
VGEDPGIWPRRGFERRREEVGIGVPPYSAGLQKEALTTLWMHGKQAQRVDYGCMRSGIDGARGHQICPQKTGPGYDQNPAYPCFIRKPLQLFCRLCVLGPFLEMLAPRTMACIFTTTILVSGRPRVEKRN